jgi:hypothetical protein
VATYTAEQSLERYKKALGQDYGTAFHYCQQHFWKVTAEWDFHETLFGNPSRVDLLNKCDGGFWGRIQDCLFDQTILGLCRLTDPPKSFGKRNLSIRALEEFQNESEQPEFSHLIEQVRKNTEFCRDWRNRRIAHNDFAHNTNEFSSLQGASREAITAALKSILDCLRFVLKSRMDTHSHLVPLGNPHATQVLIQLFHGAIQLEADSHALQDNGFVRDLPDWLFPTEKEGKRYD